MEMQVPCAVRFSLVAPERSRSRLAGDHARRVNPRIQNGTKPREPPRSFGSVDAAPAAEAAGQVRHEASRTAARLRLGGRGSSG